MSMQGAQPYPPHPHHECHTIESSSVTPSMAPTNPQSGMQYSALASLTATSGILHGLPALGVSLPEFRLIDTQHPSVLMTLRQKHLDHQTRQYQADYLRRLVDSVHVQGIRFPAANQITSLHANFTPPPLPPLSRLSAAVIDHPVNPRRLMSPLQPRADSVYRLPVEDPLLSLYRLKLQADALSRSLSQTQSIQPSTMALSMPETSFSTSITIPSGVSMPSAPPAEGYVQEQPCTTEVTTNTTVSFTEHEHTQSNTEATTPKRKKRQAEGDSDDEKDRHLEAKRTKATKSHSTVGSSTHSRADTTNETSSALSSRSDSDGTGSLSSVSSGTYSLGGPYHSPASSALRISMPHPMRTSVVQEEDPVIEFENVIKQLLDVRSSSSQEHKEPQRLSVVDLRNIVRLTNQLSNKGLMNEVQMEDLTHLLKYLEAFVSDPKSRRSFPLDGDNDDSGTEIIDNDDLSSTISTGFDDTILTMEHITLAVSILNSKDIPQHIYPEELLVNSLDVFKGVVEKVLVPALEFSKDVNAQTRGFKVFTAISCSQPLRQRMLSFVSTACHLSHNLAHLCETEISDTMLVKLVYLALALFFIDTSANMMVGPVETESLKLSGTNLLRQIFTQYPTQRLWILEEILSSLIKLPHGKKVAKGYRLADGTKVNSSTALILQLIQACSESELPDNSLPKNFFEMTPALQRTELRKLIDLLKPASDSAHASMAYVFKFLLSRSTKNNKSSIEADYRTALDCMVTDLLTVLGHPEWPAAEQCLYIYSTSMVRFLDDAKSELSTRAMAVDSLGMIAAKIKTIMLRCKKNFTAGQSQSTQGSDEEEVRTLFYGEINETTSINDLISLQASYSKIIGYVQPLELNDRAIKAAKCFWVRQWANLLCSACSTDKDAQDAVWAQDCWNIVVEETMNSWRILTGHSQPKTTSRVPRTGPLESSEYLTSRQPLFQSFDLLLSRILLSLEGNLVTLRAKSLKSLSMIVTGDYGVLSQQNVRKTISLRLQDSSPAVRDAAIDLVGKYMLEDKDILKAYYEIVSDRLSDTGLNVRKRVIRLLRDIFAKTEARAVKHDISKKVLWRVKDDEPTVRELAIKSAYEIWFGQFVQAMQSVVSTSKSDEELRNISQVSPLSTVTTSQKRDVLRRARTLVDALEQLSPALVDAFGSVLLTLLNKNTGVPSSQSVTSANMPISHEEFSRVCHVLVDCLVDLVVVLQEEEEEGSKAGIISTIHTLSIFSKAEPRLIQARHLATLQTYLVGSSTAEDWRITMHVLKIYLNTIPVAQEATSLAFAQSVEKLLSSLLSSCPLVVVPDAAHALCLVVRLLTLQSARLCKLIQSCVGLLKTDLERFQTHGSSMTENKTRRLLLITGLLCKHFPFDNYIQRHSEEAHLAALSSNLTPSVHEAVFSTLLSYFSKDLPVAVQQTALRCIGYVFHSFPTLMNTSKGIELMDSVFAEKSSVFLVELLQHFCNFLVKTNIFESDIDSSSAANGSVSNGVKRGVTISQATAAAKATRSLVAVADDHLEAGIASAVMQRYLDRILQCTLMLVPDVQSIAVDVMAIVTQQALVHPILCMPAIVALETSTDRTLSDRAFRVHKDLHYKHASLIYAKSLDCIRTMYMYQKQIQSGELGVQGYKVVEGHPPKSLLNPMYSLVSEKRQVRQSLLLGLVKLLDVDTVDQSSIVDPTYVRFIGELLATLEYRTMEEILFVIFYLNRIIAGAGMWLLESLTEQRESSDEGDPHGAHLLSSSSTHSAHLALQASGKGKAIATSKRGKRRGKKGISNDSMVAGNNSGHRYTLLNREGSGEDEECDSVLVEWYSKIPDTTFRLLEKTAQGGIALETVILVKSHLKHVYDISESRCQQFQPSAHASHKEKPHAIRATPGKLPWNKTPLGIQLLVTRGLSTSATPAACGADDGVAVSDYERAKRMKAFDIQLARFRRLIEAESVEKLTESLESRSEPSGNRDDSSAAALGSTGETVTDGVGDDEAASGEDA